MPKMESGSFRAIWTTVWLSVCREIFEFHFFLCCWFGVFLFLPSPFLLTLPSPPSFSSFLLPLLPFLPHPSHSLSYLTASSMDPGNVRVAVRVRKVLDHEQDDELCLTNTDKAIDLFNYKSPTDTLKFK